MGALNARTMLFANDNVALYMLIAMAKAAFTSGPKNMLRRIALP